MSASEPYKSGLVASLISKQSSKQNGSQIKSKDKRKLSALFSTENVVISKQINSSQCQLNTGNTKRVARQPAIETEGSPKAKKLKIKAKKKFKKTEQKKSHVLNECEQTISGEEEEDEVPSKPTNRDIQRLNRKKFKAKTGVVKNRTIFVGNIPTTLKKKELKNLFKKFGAIESVRLRCPPPADPRIPKKVVYIKQDFHKERKTAIGYVVFEEEAGAKKAVTMNGSQLPDGQHLRVDLASKDKEHDHKCSVFVGNLPFNIEEEAVRQHFEECGEVLNVRVIRDNKTGIGKGFCYVLFPTSHEVFLALKLNGSKLCGRDIRVYRSQEKPEASKYTENKHKKRKTFHKDPKKTKDLKPDNQEKTKFSEKKNKKKIKKKKKLKTSTEWKKKQHLKKIFNKKT